MLRLTDELLHEIQKDLATLRDILEEIDTLNEQEQKKKVFEKHFATIDVLRHKLGETYFILANPSGSPRSSKDYFPDYDKETNDLLRESLKINVQFLKMKIALNVEKPFTERATSGSEQKLKAMLVRVPSDPEINSSILQAPSSTQQDPSVEFIIGVTPDYINELRDSGWTEETIHQELQEQGLSETEIGELLNNPLTDEGLDSEPSFSPTSPGSPAGEDSDEEETAPLAVRAHALKKALKEQVLASTSLPPSQPSVTTAPTTAEPASPAKRSPNNFSPSRYKTNLKNILDKIPAQPKKSLNPRNPIIDAGSLEVKSEKPASSSEAEFQLGKSSKPVSKPNKITESKNDVLQELNENDNLNTFFNPIEEENRLQAEQEQARLRAARETQLKSEQEAAHLRAEREAQLKAEQEAARLKAEREAQLKAEQEAARLKAEREAQLKAEQETARLKAEREAQLKAEQEAARLRAEREAQLKADQEAARLKAERDARLKDLVTKSREARQVRQKDIKNPSSATVKPSLKGKPASADTSAKASSFAAKRMASKAKKRVIEQPKKVIDLTKAQFFIHQLDKVSNKTKQLSVEAEHTKDQAGKVKQYAENKFSETVPFSGADKETILDIREKARKTLENTTASLADMKDIINELNNITPILEKIYENFDKYTVTVNDQEINKIEMDLLKSGATVHQEGFAQLTDSLTQTKIAVQDEITALEKINLPEVDPNFVKVSFKKGIDQITITNKEDKNPNKQSSVGLKYIQTGTHTEYRTQENELEKFSFKYEDENKQSRTVNLPNYVVTAFQAFYSHYKKHGSINKLPILANTERSLYTLLTSARALGISAENLNVKYKEADGKIRRLEVDEVKQYYNQMSLKAIDADESIEKTLNCFDASYRPTTREFYENIFSLARTQKEIEKVVDVKGKKPAETQDALSLRDLRAEAKVERPSHPFSQAMGTLFSKVTDNAVKTTPDTLAQEGKNAKVDLDQQLEDKPSSSANFSKK